MRLAAPSMLWRLVNDLAAIPEIRPLSKTDPESVTEVTKWLDSHTKPAGNGHGTSQPLNGDALRRRDCVDQGCSYGDVARQRG